MQSMIYYTWIAGIYYTRSIVFLVLVAIYTEDEVAIYHCFSSPAFVGNYLLGRTSCFFPLLLLLLLFFFLLELEKSQSQPIGLGGAFLPALIPASQEHHGSTSTRTERELERRPSQFLIGRKLTRHQSPPRYIGFVSHWLEIYMASMTRLVPRPRPPVVEKVCVCVHAVRYVWSPIVTITNPHRAAARTGPVYCCSIP